MAKILVSERDIRHMTIVYDTGAVIWFQKVLTLNINVTSMETLCNNEPRKKWEKKAWENAIF